MTDSWLHDLAQEELERERNPVTRAVRIAKALHRDGNLFAAAQQMDLARLIKEMRHDA